MYTVWAEKIRLFQSMNHILVDKLIVGYLHLHGIVVSVCCFDCHLFAPFSKNTQATERKRARSTGSLAILSNLKFGPYIFFFTSVLPLEEILELTVFNKCFLVFSHNRIRMLKDLE